MAAEAAPDETRVAVVILNYRTPELTIACLESAVADLAPADRVVVVDNASGDDSVERISGALRERAGARAELVEAPRNGGFAAGNNAGIRAVSARAYLLLNSDTLVRPGCVERLWASLQERADVGLASPRLEWPDGRPQVSCFRYHTPASELIDGARTGLVRRALRSWDVPLPIRDDPFEPPWTSFAAILIRRDVVERIGLLDEGYFMYYEDVDYCRRARAAGFRILHDPRARVVHLRGGTSPLKKLTAARRRRPAYFYASRNRYFEKFYGRAGRLCANALRSTGWAVARLREMAGGERRTIEREILDTWTV